MINDGKAKLMLAVCVLGIVSMLSGCGLGFSHNEHLIGPYRLIAVDTSEQMTVVYDLGDGGFVGRIPQTVFSVGWNDNYIVAKQHPNNNRSFTNYYFLEIAKDSAHAGPKESVTGPLTQEQFAVKQAELQLPPFTRTIKSLE